MKIKNIKKDILLNKVIENLNRNKHSNFLDQNELNFIIKYLNKLKIDYNVFYSFTEAERVIIYKDNIPDISLIEIKTTNILKHSDILGFLYNFQIDIGLIGDIIVDDKYFIICKSEIKDYLIYNISKIKKYNVILKEANLEYLNNYKRKYETIKLLVPSLRIDVIIAKITKKSRSEVLDIIKDKQVLLNYEILEKITNLKENDVFSIRKYGKYIYKGIDGNTKNNIVISLDKYI